MPFDVDLPAAADSSPPDGVVELTWIGTATVLLRAGGFTILTDPNFLHAGESAYIGLGLRTRRLTDPSMELADLPPIDLVVLSHHHGDHFDQVVARDLDKDLPIVTEPHSARKLESQGFRRAIPLETWDSARFRRGDAVLTVTSLPGRHAPEPLQRLVPHVMGSLLELPNGRRIYISGDTLVFDRLREIPRRYPDIDLCLLHLGGTRVAGILLTMNAEQGIEALRIVQPHTAVPIHHGDYTVFKEPIDVFRDAVPGAGLSTTVELVERGKPVRFPMTR